MQNTLCINLFHRVGQGIVPLESSQCKKKCGGFFSTNLLTLYDMVALASPFDDSTTC